MIEHKGQTNLAQPIEAEVALASTEQLTIFSSKWKTECSPGSARVLISKEWVQYTKNQSVHQTVPLGCVPQAALALLHLFAFVHNKSIIEEIFKRGVECQRLSNNGKVEYCFDYSTKVSELLQVGADILFLFRK